MARDGRQTHNSHLDLSTGEYIIHVFVTPNTFQCSLGCTCVSVNRDSRNRRRLWINVAL